MDSPASPILVATVPLAALRLRRILEGYVVDCPPTYVDATRALSRDKYALAILGVYFDESRMFDLISHARAAPKNAATPVVCVLGVRGKLSPMVLRSLEQTLTAMPRTSFLNLAAIADDPDGNAFVRRYLDSVLNLGVSTPGVSTPGVSTPGVPTPVVSRPP